MKESGGFKSVTITNTDRNKFNEKKFDEDSLNKVLNETSPTLLIQSIEVWIRTFVLN